MDGDLLVVPSKYRSMVDALQYLPMTRPDIAFSVQYLSQFLQAPTQAHEGYIAYPQVHQERSFTRSIFQQ